MADRGWEMFRQRAWLGDNKWTYEHARAKAASTVRRIRDGRLKIERELAKATRFFFAGDLATPIQQLRALLRNENKHNREIFWGIEGAATYAFA